MTLFLFITSHGSVNALQVSVKKFTGFFHCCAKRLYNLLFLSSCKKWKIYIGYKERLEKIERQKKIHDEEMEKIKPQIQLYDMEVKNYETWLNEIKAGVKYKIKNGSDKIIKRLELTFYFKDKDNNIIYEDTLLSIYEEKPLKAGYIWQTEEGKISVFDNVPSEWQEGNYEVKITEIETE